MRYKVYFGSKLVFSTCTCYSKAVSDSILRPEVCYLVAPPGESIIICYVADFKPVSVFGPKCENMTSSTKTRSI